METRPVGESQIYSKRGGSDEYSGNSHYVVNHNFWFRCGEKMRLLENSRLFWIVSVPLFLIFILLTITGSRILIAPGKLEVSPCGEMIMFRSYPLAEVFNLKYPIVQRITTVTPLTRTLNHGYSCREDNGAGERYNRDQGRGFGSNSLGVFAEACLSDPIGFIVDVRYSALLFDIIPLRPIQMETVVLTDEAFNREVSCSGIEIRSSNSPRRFGIL